MTPNEFRGFIVNLVLNGLVIGAIYLEWPGIPVWAYVLIGLGLCMLLPLPYYHPTRVEKEADKIRRSTVYIPPGE